MPLKTKIKNVFLLCGCILAVIGIARFCHHATKGFSLSKIRSNFPEGVSPIAASENETSLVTPLLQQKFHYMGRGLQSFAFESEDGEYVLKLFNNRYQRKIGLFSLLSHFPLVNRWAISRADYFRGKLLKTFQSYQLAFDEMSDKTGLLYVHLNPTSNLPCQVTLIDPLHICHEINPNEIGFLLQKRATLVYPALKKYMECQDREGARHALSSLLELFFWKWRHGIADNDPLIRTNYGFVGSEAIQIDVGPLSKQASTPTPEERRHAIDRITASLKFWLNENAPELIPFLDWELQQQLSSLE